MRATYGAGSTLRLVATALNGAAAGNAAGGLSDLVRGAAVNVLQGLAVSEIKNHVDRIADPATRETTRAALQAVVGCAGAAATGAAASVVLNNLIKSGTTTSVGPDGKPLGLQSQQARTDLVATIVAGLGEALGSGASPIAVLAAQLETENNANVAFVVARLSRPFSARARPRRSS